jgi:hypothetical protein
MADAERAIKHGDDVARELAEARIDKLFEGARAARPAGQEPAQPLTGFDGGVRRGVSVKPPPNMNGLIARSVAERRVLAAAARSSV